MIRSMTGYGAAERTEDGPNGVRYVLEIRSVNHRYLKLSYRLPDQWQFAENVIEKMLRSRLVRGSVTCALRVRRDVAVAACPINVAVLQAYVEQMAKVAAPNGTNTTIDLGALAQLPGVTDAPDLDDDARAGRIAMIEELTGSALDSLGEMRRQEGESLRAALLDCCESISSRLVQIADRSPLVIDEYHERLKTRVAALMQQGGFELKEEGLMREVALFAERCDIDEEITRLRSHLVQFTEMCDRREAVGRTLDFLTQELLREANTIASKSNDANITQDVVEIKGLIDRLKEQVQNVE